MSSLGKRTMPAPESPAEPAEASGSAAPSASSSEPVLAPGALDALLELAREAVVAVVAGGPGPDPAAVAAPALRAPADAFVTLRRRGELRGCIGTLGAGWPVGRSVVHAAGLAATEDPRFEPVASGELAGLDMEVSVLGPPRPLADVADFVPGSDGIVVEARGRRALLLPQVATEMGWGTAEMLAAVCEKAGLRHDAWRDPATRLAVFEVVRVEGPVVPA
jgi:AmmeMemoRadiSam system protein A